VNGKQLEEQYRDYLSDYPDWEQLSHHANDWILFEENLGTHLSLGETTLSPGELTRCSPIRQQRDVKEPWLP